MYREYFELRANPFSMTPDPSVLYVTPSHRESLAGLAYAIFEKKGFVVLVGEAGTGKSTLLARTLRYMLSNRVVSSVILNPTLTEAEFLELMMLDFGFTDVPASKAQRLTLFQDFLIRTSRAGKIAVLVVDEAHKMTPALLEEVRLLSNLEFPGEKLLQIVLAGQPELTGVLARPDLQQLSQRIAVRLKIDRLTAADVEQYIAFRWTQHTLSASPFSGDAARLVARFSGGIPRLVNSICDNALMAAFADKSRVVEGTHVEIACRDLSLTEQQVSLPSHNGTGTEVEKRAAVRNGAPAARMAAGGSLVKPPAPVPIAELSVLASYSKRRSFWSWVSGSRPAQQKQ